MQAPRLIASHRYVPSRFYKQPKNVMFLAKLSKIDLHCSIMYPLVLASFLFQVVISYFIKTEYPPYLELKTSDLNKSVLPS